MREKQTGKKVIGLAVINNEDRAVKGEYLEALQNKGAEFILWTERNKPENIKKRRRLKTSEKNSGREKRVDIAISREMLINAFNQNYDLGILVAGDEDYVDLVQDIKRFGVRIIGSFFRQDLSKTLELAVDNFHELHVWGENRKELVKSLGGKLPEPLAKP